MSLFSLCVEKFLFGWAWGLFVVWVLFLVWGVFGAFFEVGLGWFLTTFFVVLGGLMVIY